MNFNIIRSKIIFPEQRKGLPMKKIIAFPTPFQLLEAVALFLQLL
jgi:hypothetical protein